MCINMCYRYVCWPHSCMRVINLTDRYFTLNFRCNGGAGRGVAAPGISSILWPAWVARRLTARERRTQWTQRQVSWQTVDTWRRTRRALAGAPTDADGECYWQWRDRRCYKGGASYWQSPLFGRIHCNNNRLKVATHLLLQVNIGGG